MRRSVCILPVREEAGRCRPTGVWRYGGAHSGNEDERGTDPAHRGGMRCGGADSGLEHEACLTARGFDLRGCSDRVCDSVGLLRVSLCGTPSRAGHDASTCSVCTHDAW